MKSRFNKAQEAVEFILITALVFFGVVFTVMIFGEKIASFFTEGSSVVHKAQSSSSVIDSKKEITFKDDYETSVELNDKQSLMVCTGGNCTLKVGEMAISDIPEDFNSYVSTTGSSGGTETISKIYKSLADAINQQGLTSESEEIRKLASLAYNISVVEKTFESMVNACNGNETCLRNLDMKMGDPFSKPAGYDETYISFPQGVTYNNMLSSGCFGEASTDSPYIDKNVSLATKYLKQLQAIQSESQISDEVKSLIKELSWSVGTIGEDFEDNYNLLSGKDVLRFNPDTGEPDGEPYGISDVNKALENFNTYSASRITDFKSNLICASSGSEEKCH